MPPGLRRSARRPERKRSARTCCFALAVVTVAARLVGLLFRRLGQPPVIGEVIAGIMLGPSLLGRLAPAASAFLLPPSIAPVLGIIAQVG